MKLKNISLLLFTFISISVFSADIKLNDGENYFRVTSKSVSDFTFINSISEMQTIVVKTEEGDFIKLVIPSYSSDSKDGDAELPIMKQLIRVPFGSEMKIIILNKEETIINLTDYEIDLPLFPNQPSVSKSATDIPFYYNSSYYDVNDFHSSKLVKTELLGKMRGQQLARLSLSPIQYNPVTNQLKIITKVEVKVIFENVNITKDVANREKYYSSQFETLFKSCVNYTSLSQKDVITTYPVKYVIISDPMYQTALQPLINWKTKKGFLVVEEYTNNPLVGNTTASIHAFLKNMYDNATLSDPAPTYLLLVGDYGQVTSFSGSTGSHVSDMYYCEFDGNGDFYPEMYYGRFSATSVADVEVQVSKTLTHEKYTFSDPSFLDEVILVAGVDGSFAPTHGNGQINYGTDNYFNSTHGLTIHNYLYGSGTPIISNSPQASPAIIANISNGSGFANYTAHCSSTGWADPSFVVSDVPGLLNSDAYGFMVGNCCLSNKFDDPVCFGEALLRLNNRGAVGYIGGSNNTYWDEDFWWAVGSTSNITSNPTYAGTGLGLYDCLMHENGEAQSDWFFTAAQMIHSGNLAVTQAGGSEKYYWEIYHLMGDPSLMPYIGVPTTLTVSHPTATPVGTNSFTVTTEENAYVAISMNGILLDAKLAGPTGIVNLSFTALSNVGTADIVVTKQFKQAYISALSIISPNAPFVIYNMHTINDPTGNNNLVVDYNELIELDVELNNVGSQPTQNVNVVISTTDQYVTLIDSTDFLATVNASNTINISAPFTFQVASFVPDQHMVTFTLNITDNSGNSWNSSLFVTLNSPILGDVLFTIEDITTGNGNGKLDAGETLNLIIDIENSGHAESINLNAILGSLSSYVTVNNPFGVNLSSLMPLSQQSATFSITVDANTPFGTVAEFPFSVTDGIYSDTNTFSATIGVIDEDYETGDFTQYSWVQGQYPWFISTNNPYEGSSCSRSFNSLPDNQDSEIEITVNVITAGDISFFKKLSSEEDYDFLKFKINGQKVGEWSGIDTDWSWVSFPVGVGTNTFEWEYDKDLSTTDGMDCAFIDYIVFPSIDLGNVALDNQFSEINLFPNPTMGMFEITFSDNENHTALIYDINGKLIFSNTSSENIVFDISNHSTGTYTIKIMPEAITYTIVKN